LRKIAVTNKPYIDPTAIVHPDAQLGNGVVIWNWTKVREGAVIGDDTNIGQSAYIDFDTKIGARCKIQNGVSVYHGVAIGNDVFLGPNATLTNDLVPRAHSAEWSITETSISDGVSIGANATIVCGVSLGAHCMVAAGAVVTKDVPPHALVMGCPARIVDFVTVSGKRLNVETLDTPPDATLLNDVTLKTQE
jgi:UDP-2-acetamido-3-amino-2,3-dideoxy-glucuronate N-acetyltransferase